MGKRTTGSPAGSLRSTSTDSSSTIIAENKRRFTLASSQPTNLTVGNDMLAAISTNISCAPTAPFVICIFFIFFYCTTIFFTVLPVHEQRRPASRRWRAALLPLPAPPWPPLPPPEPGSVLAAQACRTGRRRGPVATYVFSSKENVVEMYVSEVCLHSMQKSRSKSL